MSFIGLLDCNNFFVSCERLFRPDLRHRPTLVLSSNDGCVVARSQEVKDMGIPMGVPYFKVRDELRTNNVAVFSSNFQLYRDISSRVMNVLKNEVDRVEQYSVDEAFFLIDEAEPKAVVELLHQIKQTIERQVGVPVSVGAGRTMTIAKYASEKEKKGKGICFLEGPIWKEETNKIPVGEIWGIGGKTSSKMRHHGVETVADLLKIDRSRIERLFGIHGLRLLSELSETPAHSIDSSPQLQKSIMSTRSFAKETVKLSVIEDAISYHVSEAAKELREIDGQANRISVLIRPSRHGDWALRGGSLEVILPEPTSDTRVLLREALTLVRRLYEPKVPYKKAGVVLASIEDAKNDQMNLFHGVEELRDSLELMSVVDALNVKIGKDSVTIGRTKNTNIWKASSEHISPRYTTNWNELASVQ